MERANLSLVAAALLLAVGACATHGRRDLPATIVRPQPAQRTAAWREDLDFLARGLAERHVAPFRKVSEADFRSAVARLHGRIPELDDDGVVIEMARIAASIGDGHTGILLHDGRVGLRPGPLWLALFADGVFVKGVVGDPGADVLNLQLVRVGGVAVDEALERVAEFLPMDNDVGIELLGPTLLNVPRVLHAAGLTEERDGALYTFVGAGGDELELRCGALAPGTPAMFAVRYAPGSSGPPLAERLRAKSYAYERIGDCALLQYNACRNAPDESFRDFCRRAFEGMDRDPPRRLVVDLRGNMGGLSTITNALLRELRRRRHLRGPERLRVLIGRGTFSSGMWAAVDLAREFDALLVGEATASTPNAPGERGEIVLPNSKLVCGYSRRMWNKGGERFDGPTLEPDLLVRETSTEHFAGRDPALEAALAD